MSEPLPRVVSLDGATNFRDLGGYRTESGRELRWRRLFRSDHLGSLTPADREVLAQLGVAAAYDFRGVDERAAVPYEVPGLAQHALSIEPTVVQHMNEITAGGRALTGAIVQGLMEDLYRALIETHAHRYAELFAHLLRAEAPLVFHCTAGKDRTGVAAALVLLALGVPRETVMQDYLLTNEFFKPHWAPPADLDADTVRALWGVRPEYLLAAFDVLDRRGGPESWLRREIGLDKAQVETLAQRYLLPL
jgi:protein-tyrosine phosphatase